MINFRSKIIIGIAVSLIAVMGLTQNCSNKSFTTTTITTLSQSSGSLKIEDGRTATNKRVLNIEIVGVPDVADQMRVGFRKDLVDGTFPETFAWKPYQKKFDHDLDVEYASNGSKDAMKEIVVEVKDSNTVGLNKSLVEGVILLDTIPPEVELKGLLKTGLPSQSVQLGDTVEIDWTAKDIPAPSGTSSGLDLNQAIQVGWTDSEDCSKVITANLSTPMPDNAGARSFVWPKASILDNFFLCIFVKDLAGNRTTGLSQPMTQLWKVIAGDNNQGNGGTWKASNTRFGTPNKIAVDKDNNLYIHDSDFRTIRKVTTDGAISTWLGNGRSGDLTGTNRHTSPLGGVQDLFFDKANRLYISAVGIRRITVDETVETNNLRIEPLVTADRAVFDAQVAEIVEGTAPDQIIKEYMIFSTARTVMTSAEATIRDIHIYKVPMSAFAPPAQLPISINSLSSYIIAGSGPGATAAMARTIPAASPLAVPRSLTVDANGDIYVGFSTDGNSLGIGEHCISILRNGELHKLTRAMPTWPTELIITKDATDKKMLYVAGWGTITNGFSVGRMNIDSLTLPLATDVQVTGVGPIKRAGGLALAKHRVANEPVIYATDNFRSKVVKYIDLTFADEFGRDIYDPNETRALNTVVNTPTSLVEDANHNIYIYEPLSFILRKLDPSGSLTVFAGTPGKEGANTFAALNDKSLNALELPGTDHLIGYQYPLAFQASTNSVFLGLGSGGRIVILPLDPSQKSKVLNTDANPLIADTVPTASRYRNKNAWPNSDIDLVTSGSTENLLVGRGLHHTPFRAQLVGYAANADAQRGAPVIGNEIIGTSNQIPSGLNLTAVGANNNVALAGQRINIEAFEEMIYYFHGNNLLQSDATNVTRLATDAIGGINLTVTKDAQGRLFFFTLNGNDIAVNQVGTDKVLKTGRLCLPGSFVAANDIKVSRDGRSLLIADTNQRRVIQYAIRQEGSDEIKLYVPNNPTGGCKAF